VAAATALSLGAQEDQSPGPDTGSPAVTGRHELPAGYLGIVFTCRLKSGWGPDGLAVIHYEYPAVASVQAESPAAHAGIEPGDTIVAYNGRDVRDHVIVLNKLLQPNAQLAIRLRRNGQLRDVVVNIARRPHDFVDVSVAAPPGMPAMPPEVASLAAASGSGATVVAPPEPPFPALPPRPPSVPWWALIGPDVIDGNDVGAFGGAHVVETTADLRQALGLSSGLLVVAVDAGTPAAESSLRAGDVIVSADGDPIATPRQLLRVVERTMVSRTSVALEVERQHRKRHVVLNW
jgi:S1-C subfamily serine protease